MELPRGRGLILERWSVSVVWRAEFASWSVSVVWRAESELLGVSRVVCSVSVALCAVTVS